MLRGLATISYWTDDLEAAKAWYAEFLGIEPYFGVGDGYAEFRIGDYEHEFGLINRKYAPEGDSTTAGGTIAYWAVDDLDATLARLISLGATQHQPPTVRGDGFVTASVIDPFGNILGVMTNVHYFDILARDQA
ncbi:VOC family protein [Nonomuraea sp. NPDC050556]|uniref:VOC family protein n=1 Tax=Nonomuraea sp. NPDC050556 TaxID=3364369 RepID=UPI0037A1A893